MKYLLGLIGLLVVLSVEAQTVRYVVPGGKGDKGGGAWTNAMADVKAALEVAGVTEVRVKWGTYSLREELSVPAGVVLSGGWDEDGERKVGGTEATILKAVNSIRVVTVAGILDGFTVMGGLVAGKDGGGIYVKSSGEVRNCIVKQNMAVEYYPKVGDAYCTDGSFLSRENINDGNRAGIRGIVFWVNPDPEAAAGNRGWVMALEGEISEWAKAGSREADECVTGVAFVSMESALADTSGYAHTEAIKNSSSFNPDNCDAALYCWTFRADKGENWYLPAVGQLRALFDAWREVVETYWIIDTEAKLKGWYLPDYDIEYLSSSEEGTRSNNVWTFGMSMYGGDSGVLGFSKKNQSGVMTSTRVALPVTSF